MKMIKKSVTGFELLILTKVNGHDDLKIACASNI